MTKYIINIDKLNAELFHLLEEMVKTGLLGDFTHHHLNYGWGSNGQSGRHYITWLLRAREYSIYRLVKDNKLKLDLSDKSKSDPLVKAYIKGEMLERKYRKKVMQGVDVTKPDISFDLVDAAYRSNRYYQFENYTVENVEKLRKLIRRINQVALYLAFRNLLLTESSIALILNIPTVQVSRDIRIGEKYFKFLQTGITYDNISDRS